MNIHDQTEPKLTNGKRIVVKIGSNLLVDKKTHSLDQQWLGSLIADIADYIQTGQQWLIVSSGAVSMGRLPLRYQHQPLKLAEQQAAAATGQIRLAHAYQTQLQQHQLTAAQILLTLDDTENRRRYLNAKNTLETLLQAGAVPIINENDTVATAELRYGDNDRLAARVAQMVAADILILLSDVDGLYSHNPHTNDAATFIPIVNKITTDIEKMATDSTNNYGSGGMITKLAAAKIALDSGCRMLITNGQEQHPLAKIDQGKRCTWFLPKTTPNKARKNWLRHHLQPKGEVLINQGALTALLNGKSLLPAGIVAIQGDFYKGDIINILNPEHQVIARGLSHYSAQEARQIMSKQSHEIVDILGYSDNEEFIHRDNLAMLEHS